MNMSTSFRKSYPIFSLTVAVSFCLSSARVQAADWPQWRGPNRDGKASGFNAPKAWPKELTQKWKVAVGKGDATPALAGDKLYVFTRQEENEVVRSVEAGTGKEVWQDKYEAQGATGAAGAHPGPRSSPTVADGKVVTFGVRGTLSCLEAASGKKLWRKDGAAGDWPKFFTASSPIVVDGLCIAQVGGENNGAMAAYDLASGNEKWKWSGDGTAYSSPVLLTLDGTKVLVAETDKNLVAVGVANGKLLWQTPFAGKGMSGHNDATPIVDGQTIIYSGSGRGTKAVKLEKKGDDFTANELWSNAEQSVQYNSPVLKDGFVFGISGRDTFFCLNAKNGQTAWTAPSGGKRGFGSIVDAGSVLMALTPSSQLIVLEPSDKEFKQLTSYKAAESETYAYPVPAGSRVYVKDQDSLTLWSFE